MQTSTFVRRPTRVEAVQVSAANIYDIAKWTQGEVLKDDEGVLHLKIDIFNPLREYQKNAEVGDWICKSGRGFKVYNQRAFEASFEPG